MLIQNVQRMCCMNACDVSTHVFLQQSYGSVASHIYLSSYSHYRSSSFCLKPQDDFKGPVWTEEERCARPWTVSTQKPSQCDELTRVLFLLLILTQKSLLPPPFMFLITSYICHIWLLCLRFWWTICTFSPWSSHINHLNFSEASGQFSSTTSLRSRPFCLTDEFLPSEALIL